MPKRQFEATEGLLNDVMRKQAGTVEKAVLEAVMNSVDAGASKVDVSIKTDAVVVEDDGKGMSEEDIENYFQKFGLKDSDIEDKEFGKFRMGRGQIFNFGKNIWHTKNNILVVDLDNNHTVVNVDGDTHELDSSGLSYNVLNTSDEFDGCSIEVELYNLIDGLQHTVNEVKKLVKYIPWLHDIELTLNGEELYEEFDYNYETENAYYSIGVNDAWRFHTSIYNLGAYVTDEKLTATRTNVVSKKDLDVNFARNDILDTCIVYKTIKQEIDGLTLDHLFDKDDLTRREVNWTLDSIKGDDRALEKFGSKEIIPDVTGDEWSIEQLKDEKISFQMKQNKMSDKAMDEAGVIVIDSSFEDAVKNLIDSSSIYSMEDVIDQEMKWEMRPLSTNELTKKRVKNLERARWFLREIGFDGSVSAGYSKTERVWKDNTNTVYIDKSTLNMRKDEFICVALDKCIEMAAHDGSTRTGVSHNMAFRQSYWKYSKNAGEYRYKLINGDVSLETH